ncbi:MAG TPA: hemolysin family protein [Methanomicrobiales archaeon]|nr:hemolysin family protein [Methanomicrobiales archaeon]
MSDLWILMLIPLCIALEGIFSGGEIAFLASDPNIIRPREKDGIPSARLALRLLDRPEWFLATTLTGTVLCVTTSTVLATSLLIGHFGPARGEWISVAIMVPIVLIFGEILPKSICRQHAEKWAMTIAPFLWVASWVLYPLVFLISKIARGAVYVLAGERGKLSLPYITKDGLKYLLLEEAADTDVKRSEKVMVERIFDFSEASAGRVMVPISNVAALEDEANFGDAARLINETGFSRLPVYRGDIIDIVGVVNAFDILKQLPASAAQPVRTALRQLLYVPASKPADDLLLEMQKRGEPMAVVVDEYGGAVGIVTIEDILEEIVGDIRDEYDKRERAVRKLGPGQYLVSAHIGIDRLREIVPVSIPEGPYETLAGYLLHQMGRIPRRMEQFRAGNVKFVIEDADMKSIKQVQIILPAETSAAQKEEGQAEPQRPVVGL